MASAGIGDRVEGVHAVAAAIEAGRVHTLHVERSRLEHGDLNAVIEAARERGIRVVVDDDVRTLAKTAAPQGVVAEARPIPLLSIGEVADLGDPPAVVVLDHLEDPRNVGAIARSALASGATALVISGRRAAPLGATAFKAAAGALEHVPVAEVTSVPEALRRLAKHGLWIVGLAGESETVLWDCELFSLPVAIVVGAEGGGLHRLSAERCDVLVRIPMEAHVESLNASVAASLAMFEVARARRTSP